MWFCLLTVRLGGNNVKFLCKTAVRILVMSANHADHFKADPPNLSTSPNWLGCSLCTNYKGALLRLPPILPSSHPLLSLLPSLMLQLFSSLTMQSMVHISQSWAVPATRLWVGGTVEVKQRVPLPATGRVEQYNTSLFNASSSFAADYDIPTIISRYNERNGELSVVWLHPRALPPSFSYGHIENDIYVLLQVVVSYVTLSLLQVGSLSVYKMSVCEFSLPLF